MQASRRTKTGKQIFIRLPDLPNAESTAEQAKKSYFFLFWIMSCMIGDKITSIA
jgi:hypothetical protein